MNVYFAESVSSEGGPMNDNPYLGVGLYPLSVAARILGVHPSTVRSWVRSGPYTTRGHSYERIPVIKRHFSEESPLTFHELVELMFVKLFRQEGVPMHTIRKAAHRAAELFSSDYPFTLRRFDTDGKHIFATLKSEENSPETLQDIGRGQYAFEQFVRPFFRKLQYEDQGELVALWPKERKGRVVIDPNRDFGSPIDAETGVPTAALYKATLVEGQTAADVAFWFDVPIEAVEAAIDFEQHPEAV